MLPAVHRLRRSEDFRRAVRSGRRAGSTHLVAHLWVPESSPRPAMSTAVTTLPTPPSARVGFVVSKGVGGAVVRTAVKRRLRAVAAGRLCRLPAGAVLVVRATPASRGATSTVLARDFDLTLDRLLRRRGSDR